MKIFAIAVAIICFAGASRGEVFQMDRQGQSTVEVKESAGEYKVTCRFSPQTKFDKAINAKFNDAKGDSLCKKGLARYLNVATNETLAIAGWYTAAPVKVDGDKLCYSFGVPVSGCKVEKVESKPEPTATNPAPIAEVKDAPKVQTNATPAQKTQECPSAEAMQSNVVNVIKSSSYVCVTKYKEVNGNRTTVSRREYQRDNFTSMTEFDRFCQREFARIRALGEANLRAVRNFGK